MSLPVICCTVVVVVVVVVAVVVGVVVVEVGRVGVVLGKRAAVELSSPSVKQIANSETFRVCDPYVCTYVCKYVCTYAHKHVYVLKLCMYVLKLCMYVLKLCMYVRTYV